MILLSPKPAPASETSAITRICAFDSLLATAQQGLKLLAFLRVAPDNLFLYRNFHPFEGAVQSKPI